MKKIFKNFLTAVLMAVVLSLSMLTAFAAKGELTVNDGAVAKKGDTVTYTLNMRDCTEKLEGIQMQLMYDSEYLEIDPSSLSFPNMSGVVSNPNLADIILFSWTDVTTPVDFTEKSPLVTVDFKVKKAGDTAITYFITEMYGSDITYLKSFTLTNDISVNGELVLEDATPIIVENGVLRNEYQGDFINYADGKGEENGEGENHVAITGVTNAPSTAEDVINVTQGEDNTANIIIIVSIIVVVLAIVAAVILRRRFS